MKSFTIFNTIFFISYVAAQDSFTSQSFSQKIEHTVSSVCERSPLSVNSSPEALAKTTSPIPPAPSTTPEPDTYLVIAQRAMPQQERPSENKVPSLSVAAMYAVQALEDEQEPRQEPDSQDALDEASAEIADVVKSSPHWKGRKIKQFAKKVLINLPKK